MNFINPKIDLGFKKIFGSPQSKDILISFLNGMLYEGEPVVADLEIIDPYQTAQMPGGKESYLDVKARLHTGTFVIIEMQVLNLAGFEKRILYNAAKGYVLQLDVGQKYDTLLPVVALTITDFILFPQATRPINHFVLKERDTHFDYPLNQLELVFAELPRFTQQPEEARTLTAQWLAFLKYARSLHEIPASMAQVDALRHAFEIANQATLTPQELEALEKQEAFILDVQATIDEERQEAYEAGLQEGLQERREERRKEGAQQQALATARRMLSRLDDATISEMTGLPMEVVQVLREE
jgi:predicted transposase/invertase (TIGR01784 family)